MKLNFPGGKQLIDTPGPAVGREVKADTSRAGHVDNGLLAWPERLATARKYWPEGWAEDFEKLDRRGRRWRDGATGRYSGVTAAAARCWAPPSRRSTCGSSRPARSCSSSAMTVPRHRRSFMASSVVARSWMARFGGRRGHEAVVAIPSATLLDAVDWAEARRLGVAPPPLPDITSIEPLPVSGPQIS